MIKSMTGFGRVSRAISDRFAITVTAKSVNHRNLEVSVKLPEFLWEQEPAIRSSAAAIFARGKLDISIRVNRTSEPDYRVRINARVANAVIPQIRALLEEQGLPASLTGSDLMRVPDLLEVEAVDSDWEESEREGLRDVAGEAFQALDAMRIAEGTGLGNDIRARLVTIELRRAAIMEQRESINLETMESFRLRIAELTNKAGVEVSEDRIAQEFILMLERSDAAEELTRLGLHVTQSLLVIEGAEPAGKKLDFLCQEMLREINTLGQKSRSAQVRTTVVELKTELERVREQVQNVE